MLVNIPYMGHMGLDLRLGGCWGQNVMNNDERDFCEAHCFYDFAATEKWAPQVAPEKEGRQYIDFNHKNSRCKKCPWQVSCLVWLVVLMILKKKLVNGKDYPIYYGKKMFETTNQLCCGVNYKISLT